MVTGINHITLSVKDLDKSFYFYKEVLGCKPVARWDNGIYLLAGNMWLCLTLDKKTRTEMLPEYTHIAFAVTSEDFPQLAAKIKQSGALIWKENTSEGDSLYFLDPNGHKLELHYSDLDARIAATKLAPYSGMVFYNS